MLIKIKVLEAIARGDVDLAFRRWRRPTVKSGGFLKTVVGLLAIDSVDEISETDISNRDARRAGFESREDLAAELRRRSAGDLYRIELRLTGPDPRRALREQTELTDAELSEIEQRLNRFDKASPQGPWTGKALQLISLRPSTRAADLASSAGFETKWFKTKVRKLKELGLTESLEIGYRLSPRGEVYLASRD